MARHPQRANVDDAFSPAEIAASGDAVRAFHALVLRSPRVSFPVVDVGPPTPGEVGLWRAVLSNRRLTVWAFGMRNGSIALSIRCLDTAGILDAVLEVVPALAGAGEIRASGLRPWQAARVVERVLARQRPPAPRAEVA